MVEKEMMMTKDNIIAAKAFIQVRDELVELKSLVREFIDEIEHVPFRAVDCDQEAVYTLWNKLIEATGATNDRLGID
jgi:hypothetical protein